MIHNQIWLNLPMDDYHFGCITKIQKTNLPETGNSAWGSLPNNTLQTIGYSFYCLK
jgi:hypothetical protein